MKNIYTIGKELYITSNEEIKEGDWFITPVNDLRCADIEWIITISKFTPKTDFKKIILTTDQELIKDGVQSIDDEFLEWFVTNSSCEEVEIDKGYRGVNLFNYKIIIPKEEPNTTMGVFKGLSCEGYNNLLDIKYEKRKQETLEEAAEKYTNNWENITALEYDECIPKDINKLDFINGAKWQQERSYSDMQEYATFCIECDRKEIPLLLVRDWYEHYKK